MARFLIQSDVGQAVTLVMSRKQIPTKQFRTVFFVSILLIYYSTFKTGIVKAVVTWYIIPCIAMLSAKSVHTVFVFPIVWLAWSPKPKTTYFFVHPNVRSLHAAVIQSYPGSFAIVTVLYVDIFFLVVYCYQSRAHH